MNESTFQIYVQQLEAAKRQHMDRLNAELFADMGAHVPITPLTWRQQLQRRVARVRAYFMTLWRAVKGDDPYDTEYDY